MGNLTRNYIRCPIVVHILFKPTRFMCFPFTRVECCAQHKLSDRARRSTLSQFDIGAQCDPFANMSSSSSESSQGVMCVFIVY